MKKVIFVILIAMIFSCNEDEKINSPIDENPIPEDTIQSCNFDNFNIEYTYVHTKDGNNGIVDIFENTKYSEVLGYKKQLRFTVIQENTNDNIDNLFAVSIKSACNTTGREFDSENCRFTSRTDFMTTKVYCNDLDIFLLERLTGNELTSYNKDTIVIYEEDKGWYHYFLTNQEIEEEVKPLPNLRISSNEIYAKDDTLKIPLNINFLKNDSTKCEVFGIEVEPQYYDINNSYVLLPECDLGGGNYEMKHFVKFEAITNQDTITKIDSILFFRNKSFNSLKIYLNNINFTKFTSRGTWHPFYGSTSTTFSEPVRSYTVEAKSKSLAPEGFPYPYSYHYPIVVGLNNKKINKLHALRLVYHNEYSTSKHSIELNNLELDIRNNKNYYEFKIDDLNYLMNNLIVDYLTEERGPQSSTRYSGSIKFINKYYTDSTYLKVVLKREK